MTALQIRGSIKDNSKTFFFLFLNENIGCDSSLEPFLMMGLHGEIG